MRRPNVPEFDAFAATYDGGIGDPLKKFAGGSERVFLEQKAAWLARHTSIAGRLLDFGCGTGTFLDVLSRRGARALLEGADISGGMIEVARARTGRAAVFHALSPGPMPFGDGSFDIVTTTCVFHHILPADRVAVAQDLVRVLKPDGLLAVFEHNPWNPLTRIIVGRCALDERAILLNAGECRRLLAGAGAERCRVAFFLFFPPRLKALWPLEDVLAWLPVGGQYVVYARKGRIRAPPESATRRSQAN